MLGPGESDVAQGCADPPRAPRAGDAPQVPVIVVNDTSAGHVGCRAVMQGLSDVLRRAGMHALHRQPTATPWEDDPAFRAALAKAAVVVVNGEGTIHHANARARALARLGPFCRRTAGVPAVLLNATLAANDAALYADIADFDLVYVRDSASAVEAAAFGVPGAKVCPDLSLLRDFGGGGPHHPVARTPRVAVTDSVLPRVSGLLEELRRQRGFQPSALRYDSERRRVEVECYADGLRGLDLLVTGRYHAVCFALNTATPFVAIESNTPKISSLLRDVFGSVRRLVSPRDVLSLRVEDHTRWTDDERAALAAFRQRRTEGFRALCADLADVARGAALRASAPAAV